MSTSPVTTSAQAQNALVIAEQFFAARNFAKAHDSLASVSPKLLPSNLAAHYYGLLGKVLIELKRPADAVEPLRNAVQAQKSNAGVRMVLATALHLSGQLDDAEKQYREVMRLDPSAEVVPYNLAGLLKERADFDGAIRAYRAALAKKPTFKNALAALADLLVSRAEFAEAADLINRALQVDRNHGLSWHTAGKIAERTGNFPQALDCFTKAATFSPEFAEAWFNLGRIQARLGDQAASIESFKRAHDAEPHDEKYAFTYKHASAADSSAQMPESYVRNLFDEYAHTFDKSLVEGLGYQTPQLVVNLIQSWLDSHKATSPASPTVRALDLGCGTGLIGPLVSPYCQSLVGIDLSPKMLEKAEGRGYTALHAADITAFLTTLPPQSNELIIATDVFNYFSDLAHVFAEARRVLARDGIFAFTVEALNDESETKPFRLGVGSRFQHKATYIEAAAHAAGFHVQTSTRAALRKESQQEVEGILYALTLA
jgi:predicted TPR repeat methyltransferase